MAKLGFLYNIFANKRRGSCQRSQDARESEPKTSRRTSAGAAPQAEIDRGAATAQLPGSSQTQDESPKAPNVDVATESSKPIAETEVVHQDKGLRLFALAIAIDRYVNEDIPDLAGCTNDAADFVAFLTETLHVPQDRICRLSNEEATRSAIIQTFRTHFTENINIRRGDAMVFFYAGHGSRVVADPGWLADGNMVETIVPHDEGSDDNEGNVIYGIPDRTFDGLMRELAFRKGDNIVAVFDCCHSGGMARGALDMVPRVVPPNISPSPLPVTLDEDIWKLGLSTRSATTIVPTGFLYKAMQSHVLIAACRPDEQAMEASKVPEPRGAFTVALLKLLRSENLLELSYARVAERVQLRYQHPQCEGANKDRVVFNATKLIDTSRSFRVVKTKGQFLVDAGSIHGVVEGTEFVIQPMFGVSLDSACNIVLLATRVDASQSSLSCKPPASLPDTLRDFRVTVSYWNRPGGMKARFQYPAGNHCLVVGPDDYSDVSVHLCAGKGWMLERHDPLVTRHAPPTLNIDQADISEVLDAVSQFNFNLYRRNPHAPVKNLISVQLHRLEVAPESGLRPILRPIGRDYFDSPAENVLCAEESSFRVDPVKEAIITDMDPYYGLTLLNASDVDLFPYVFYFDPNDYSVQSWYLPHSRTMSPPLSRREATGKPSTLSIGYGASGTDSLRFSLPPGCKVDSGFLKVFVSTSYVDMRSVQQGSALDRYSRGSRSNKNDTDGFGGLWDELVCVLTCRATNL